jgi:hypothetical protein
MGGCSWLRIVSNGVLWDERHSAFWFCFHSEIIFVKRVKNVESIRSNHLRPHWQSTVREAGTAVAQAVQCLTTGWTIGVRSPTGAEDFSSSLCVQTGSVDHPVPCSMGTGGPFPGGKARPGRDADHSPPSSAEVKYEWELYLLSSHVPPWRVAGQLYFFSFYLERGTVRKMC